MRNLLTLSLLLMIFSWADAQTYLYWTDLQNNSIERQNLKTKEREVVIPGENTPRGITIDYEKGKLYFANGEDHAITVADLNGDNMQHLVYINTPVQLFLDKASQILYFNSSTLNEVYRIRTDGTDMETIITGIEKPQHMDIDLSRSKLYLSDSYDGKSKIYRANLDGSNLETLIEAEGAISGMAIDPINDYIFWLDRETKTLMRSNMDGTDQIVLCFTNPANFIVEYDAINEYVYFGEKDADRIYRIKPDGNNLEIFVDDVPELGDITLDIKNSCSSFITVYDTIAVTDTLIIDVTFTSVDEYEYINSIKLYPNPTASILHIETGQYAEELMGHRIRIVSVTGSVHWDKDFSQSNYSIDLEDKIGQTGLYYVQVVNNWGTVLLTKKLLLQ